MGTFLVESDTQTASQLSQEEAALYECLQLIGRDISAYLVDGEFSFSGLEQRLVGDGKGHSSLDLTQVCCRLEVSVRESIQMCPLLAESTSATLQQPAET